VRVLVTGVRDLAEILAAMDDRCRGPRGRAASDQRVSSTDDPWPNRPWFTVIPTFAPST
jgi:hypothetical protein